MCGQFCHELATVCIVTGQIVKTLIRGLKCPIIDKNEAFNVSRNNFNMCCGQLKESDQIAEC